ncbi:uncharacterized protein LOC118407936 [Branchiostoma floridae]|uniref:Uncharacterized protein LOC118407936 n=1 Tax=Branchiostoma floridae TaxID=7739 RepID=A0A9J7HRF3_BRAFL|nr:uncharacterized protein LOC118407936 [Branchiostoma floridae]
MDDNFIRHRLREFGTVEDSRFLTYANQGFPEILTGTRQYRMKITKHIPNSIRIGSELVTFRYNGQPRICHRCGSDEHFVAACTAVKCTRCFEIGHLATDCDQDIKCNICGGEGHSARSCQLSFANRLNVTTSWTKITPTQQNDKSVKKPVTPGENEYTSQSSVQDNTPTVPKVVVSTAEPQNGVVSTPEPPNGVVSTPESPNGVVSTPESQDGGKEPPDGETDMEDAEDLVTSQTNGLLLKLDDSGDISAEYETDEESVNKRPLPSSQSDSDDSDTSARRTGKATGKKIKKDADASPSESDDSDTSARRNGRAVEKKSKKDADEKGTIKTLPSPGKALVSYKTKVVPSSSLRKKGRKGPK